MVATLKSVGLTPAVAEIGAGGCGGEGSAPGAMQLADRTGAKPDRPWFSSMSIAYSTRVLAAAIILRRHGNAPPLWPTMISENATG